MQIIISDRCAYFTGSIGKGFGYHIQRRKNGFFAKRNSKGIVPRDGHWRFILACAQLAQTKLHIADIRVSAQELRDALDEAGISLSAARSENSEFSANDILSIASDSIR